MDFPEHTDFNQVCMGDVFKALIGKDVIVWLDGGSSPLGGKLEKYNGQFLHLTSPHSIRNTYVPARAVIAISSDV